VSKVDTWPQAPVLTTLPEVARLRTVLDSGQLLSDLRRLRDTRQWRQPRVVSVAGVGADATESDWRTLALRSIGGDGERTDPGGPELADFADTPWMRHTPYIADVVASLPATARCVRLMALGPGAHSPTHHDTKYGLPWGTVRLHAPIVAVPGARLYFDDRSHLWEPGSLWYADFTRMHRVSNEGTGVRVHLVVDLHVTPELLRLLPDAFHTPEVADGTLFETTAPEVPCGEREALCVGFDMPKSFSSFEEGDGEFLTPQPRVPAAIDHHDGHLALWLDGEATYRLVHVGDHKFRFAGWTAERTLRIGRGPDGRTVTLRTRVGSRVRALELPARARSSSAATHVGAAPPA